jgi:hypothetical protein
MSTCLSPSKTYISNPLLSDSNKGKVKVADLHNVQNNTSNMKAKRPYKNPTKSLNAPQRQTRGCGIIGSPKHSKKLKKK